MKSKLIYLIKVIIAVIMTVFSIIPAIIGFLYTTCSDAFDDGDRLYYKLYTWVMSDRL